jgi:nucleoside-triphosphatase
MVSGSQFVRPNVNALSRMKRKNILITGVPGVGKTTLIRNLITRLGGFQLAGFFTQEIREKGVRKGFELVGLDGTISLLSHVSIKSPFRVSKYGVDVAGFEKFLDSQQFLIPETDIVLIDEIGKMECFSEKFLGMVAASLDSEIPVVATISRKGGGFITAVKARSDVVLTVLTLENRDSLLADVLNQLQPFQGPPVA